MFRRGSAKLCVGALIVGGLFPLLGNTRAGEYGQDARSGQASIRGRVAMVGSGAGVPGVTIEVREIVVEGGERASVAMSSVSDGNGAFEIAGVPPGDYSVMVDGDGLFLPGDEWRAVNVMGGPVTLRDGQSVTLNYEMTPPGTIQGQVLSNGLPVPGAMVSLLHFTYEDGLRVLRECLCGEVAGWERSPRERSELARFTDENGEYLLSGVPPGEHFIVAQTPDASLLELLGREPLESGAQEWSPVYFPGTIRREAAASVRVSPGAVVSGVDIEWEQVALVAIRGEVSEELIDSGSPRVLSVAEANGEYTTYGAERPLSIEPDGSFEAYVVPFRSYVVSAIVGLGNASSGRMRVDVGRDDVDGIVLEMREAVDVPGILLADAAWPPGFDIGNLRLSMTVEMGGGTVRRSAGGRISEDGRLMLFRAPRLPHRLVLEGLPAEAFLESVTYGPTDVLETGTFTPSEDSARRLVLRVSVGTGRIVGTVRDAQGGGRGNALVSLVPEGNRSGRQDLHQDVRSDMDGSFAFLSVPPGAYRIFAWERIPPEAQRSLAFRSAYIYASRYVVVDEGGLVETEIGLISPVF